MGGTVSHKISHEFPSNCVTRGAEKQIHTSKLKIQSIRGIAHILVILVRTQRERECLCPP